MPLLKIFNNEHFENIFGILLILLFPIFLLTGSGSINFAIILLDFVFLFTVVKTKNYSFLKDKIFIALMLFWVSLILNITLSSNISNSYPRGLGFFRFIIFVMALRYFFSIHDFKYQNLIFSLWFYIFLFVTIDLLFEFYFGFNMFGFKSDYPGRLAGVLNKELKIGGYYFGFILIILSFVYKNYQSKFFILFVIFIITSLLIGERSNFIKIFLCLIPFLILINKKNILKYINYISITIVIIVIIISFNKDSKGKWSNLNPFDKNFKISEIMNQSNHNAHYDTAIQIYKKNIYFGIGLKNFRIESGNEKYVNYKFSSNLDEAKRLRWSTHPHQYHFEFLSETGTFGYISFLSFFIFSIVHAIKSFKKNKNMYVVAGTLFILASLLPLLPSGSFFTTFNGAILWLNYSLMVMPTKETKNFFLKN